MKIELLLIKIFMQKNVIIVIVLAIVIVALGVIFLWPANNQPIDQNNNNNNNTNPPPAGLEITSPKPGDTVVSPLKISGSVKGSGWTGFEGQVGIVKLFDSSNKELVLGILTATTEWTQIPTQFETTLFFDYPGDGEGKLVFYNENPSGEPERDKTFVLPINF